MLQLGMLNELGQVMRNLQQTNKLVKLTAIIQSFQVRITAIWITDYPKLGIYQESLPFPYIWSRKGIVCPDFASNLHFWHLELTITTDIHSGNSWIPFLHYSLEEHAYS